jgi:hypothetical protein
MQAIKSNAHQSKASSAMQSKGQSTEKHANPSSASKIKQCKGIESLT